MLFVLSRKTLDSCTDSPLNAGDSSYAGILSTSTTNDRRGNFYHGSPCSRTSLGSDGGSTLFDSSATNNDHSRYFESGYTDHSSGYSRSGDHDNSDSTLGSGAGDDDGSFFEGGYNDDTGYTDDSGFTYARIGGRYGNSYTGHYFGSRSTSNQDDEYYFADRRYTDDTSYQASGDKFFERYANYDAHNLGTGATDDSAGQEESPYVLPAMTGAMYLLIASTAHDVRAGFSLLVDGTCAGHRTFGVGLLIVHGVMITAAISVLLSTSQDSASVVLNGVTVIFIADLVSTSNMPPLPPSFIYSERIPGQRTHREIPNRLLS